MDGMNLRLLEYRIQRADIVIFLDIPRYLCFWRIFKRAIKYYGKETPSSAKDCREGFLNLRFIRFLKWVWDFKKRYPPKIIELFNACEDKKEIHILKSEKEIDKFLKKF
jgi:adenylate kinase family enzyme